MKLSSLFIHLIGVTICLSVSMPLALHAEGQNPDHAKSDRAKKESAIVLSPMDISEFRGVNSVEFIWLRIPGAARYHIVLARDRRFKRIVHENAGVTDTSYIVGELDFGTYFFRVNAISPDGGPHTVSDTVSMIVVPPPPSRTPLTKN